MQGRAPVPERGLLDVKVEFLEQGMGGGFEPRFNPGSNSGAGSEGGEAEYQHQEPGFNPGSTQVQPRFNPGSTQV